MLNFIFRKQEDTTQTSGSNSSNANKKSNVGDCSAQRSKDKSPGDGKSEKSAKRSTIMYEAKLADSKSVDNKADSINYNERRKKEEQKSECKSVHILIVFSFICSLLAGVLSIISLARSNDSSTQVLEHSFLPSDALFTTEVENIVRHYISINYPQFDDFPRTNSPRKTKQHVQNERKSVVNGDTSNEYLASRMKRSIRYDDNILLGPSPLDEDGRDEPEVEFFNPKLRHELERKDTERMEKSHREGGKSKGAAPGGDEWVWLTSYSRIPYGAITGFCQATKEYCPPGPTGVPGVPGAKGNRGDIGIPGPTGLDGREGRTGPRGPKGDRGMIGPPGLDGRDGIPGEPGLDGVPGRAGADGKDGISGKDGRDGLNGRHGKDGKDGSIGPIGPQGAQGDAGVRGLPGPRGRSGKPGTNGTPGAPGINAWKVKVNGTDDLLIPPSVINGESSDTSKPIVVYEKEHLRLRCAATGVPKPDIEWRREDGRTINVGSWEASSMSGHTLNFVSVHRVHMGGYRCMASNGVPPQANQTFYVEVHFAPMIIVKNQMIYAANGSVATLECEVESFPEPLRYWERFPDGKLLEPGEKYKMETHTDGYKSIMRLNVSITSKRDYGEYHCISKNEMSLARGVFHIQEHNPYVVKPLPELATPQIYGNKAPPKESFEDICGPPTMCPECPDPKDFKCKDALVSLFDLVGGTLRISPTANLTYEGLPNRTTNCVLYAVGKPVYHKFSEEQYGAWLRDPQPRNEVIAERYWCTKENDTVHLYEYANKAAYRNNANTKTYRLERPYRGNAHVVFNGSFYYTAADQPRIVRFDLTLERQTVSRELKGLDVNGSKYLYATEYNHADLNVDDNGLWVIYGTQDSNNTIVAKIDAHSMEIQYSLNISINHRKVGEMFIVCGVLYAIDSVTERNTTIRLALDLYQGKLLDKTDFHELVFTNPFRKTTTVGYNHRNKELYSWDRGNQLTYPVRYNEIGYNSSSSEPADDLLTHLKTGYDIWHDGAGDEKNHRR